MSVWILLRLKRYVLRLDSMMWIRGVAKAYPHYKKVVIVPCLREQADIRVSLGQVQKGTLTIIFRISIGNVENCGNLGPLPSWRTWSSLCKETFSFSNLETACCRCSTVVCTALNRSTEDKSDLKSSAGTWTVVELFSSSVFDLVTRSISGSITKALYWWKYGSWELLPCECLWSGKRKLRSCNMRKVNPCSFTEPTILGKYDLQCTLYRYSITAFESLISFHIGLASRQHIQMKGEVFIIWLYELQRNARMKRNTTLNLVFCSWMIAMFPVNAAEVSTDKQTNEERKSLEWRECCSGLSYPLTGHCR